MRVENEKPKIRKSIGRCFFHPVPLPPGHEPAFAQGRQFQRQAVPEENALCSNLPSGYNQNRSTTRELLPWVEF
jgi:hypothetical protein